MTLKLVLRSFIDFGRLLSKYNPHAHSNNNKKGFSFLVKKVIIKGRKTRNSTYLTNVSNRNG